VYNEKVLLISAVEKSSS